MSTQTPHNMPSNVSSGENFEKNNKKLKRPISPHLSAHRFSNNMMLSFANRVTGVALYGIPVALASGNFLHFKKLCKNYCTLFQSACSCLYTETFSAHFDGVRRTVTPLFINLRKIPYCDVVFFSLIERHPPSRLGCWLLVDTKRSRCVWLYNSSSCSWYSSSSYFPATVTDIEDIIAIIHGLLF